MKKCLIVVDYQKDFVTGSLGFQNAVKLDNRIASKIEIYHANGDVVLFTIDTHDTGYLSTREGRYLPVNHCIKGTDGHMLFGMTGKAKFDTDICFEKTTFGSEALYDYLKKTPFSHIELVGVVSNICVLSNAVLAKTAQPGTDISVDAACVASNDNSLQKAALSVMRSLQIDITNEELE